MSGTEMPPSELAHPSKYERRGAYHWAWCDRGSSSYEPAAEARYEVLARRLRGTGGRLLDVGCGDGYLLGLLSGEGVVVGVDLDPVALGHAGEKLRSPEAGRLSRASALALPFPDGCVEAVALTEVIEHLPEPDGCLREIRRVLAPGGRLVATTPKRKEEGMWDPEYHVREYGPAELRELLSRHFPRVELSYFQPSRWWTVRKRLGKGFVRFVARTLGNPFLREGEEPDGFDQILAVCRAPGG